MQARLARADLSCAHLVYAQLEAADLSKAKLSGEPWTQLISGTRQRFTGADLSYANLCRANLKEADLRGTNLTHSNLTASELDGADLTSAILGETVFANVDLGNVKGLETCIHLGPSVIDFRTLVRSLKAPIVFWRGCGLPDTLIEYIRSLTGDALQFYTCFISYSSKDQVFADRLHADLQNVGVRCWFAPHDLAIGAKTWDKIDQQIRVRDKLLVVLSKASISSSWVEDEVIAAFSEERTRNSTVLFPIRIDDSVMTSSQPWARKLCDQRNIGDFRRWKTHGAYQKSFSRLLRDLKMGSGNN
jgi:uncharacterized protein YjbI with pentapeptide repeats